MQEAELVRQCVTRYNNWIANDIDKPVREALGFTPEKLESLFNDLKDLMRILGEEKTQVNSLSVEDRSYIKSAVLHAISVEKQETERILQRTNNLEIKRERQQEENRYLDLANFDWFDTVAEFPTPRLEEYLTPQNQELPGSTPMPPKQSWLLRLWNWFRDPDNRGAAQVIGGGVVVLATGVVSVFTDFDWAVVSSECVDPLIPNFDSDILHSRREHTFTVSSDHRGMFEIEAFAEAIRSFDLPEPIGVQLTIKIGDSTCDSKSDVRPATVTPESYYTRAWCEQELAPGSTVVTLSRKPIGKSNVIDSGNPGNTLQYSYKAKCL